MSASKNSLHPFLDNECSNEFAKSEDQQDNVNIDSHGADDIVFTAPFISSTANDGLGVIDDIESPDCGHGCKQYSPCERDRSKDEEQLCNEKH